MRQMMFTGIVEAVGVIHSIRDADFTVRTPISFDDFKIGDSVAVNGVCLTIIDLADNYFTVHAVPETLRLTNLSLLMPDSLVNLERPLLSQSRMGGHYVQGHIDGVGEITALDPEGDSTALLAKIKVPGHLTKYIVNKGYVALDGMSITVINILEDEMAVTFIPHTQAVTIIQNYHKGTKINLEVDILSKYVEKWVGGFK